MRESLRSLALFLAIAPGSLLSSSRVLRADPPGGPPIAVGSRKQLFLDDYLIARTANISRTIHPAEKFRSNPVLRQTETWEDPFNIVYGSVIRDGQQYKMWYKSGPGVSYAVSDDGLHWVKPLLDFVPVNGARTNVLFRKNSELKGSDGLPYYHELFGVHKDDREPDPSRRYKMGYLSIDWEYKGPARRSVSRRPAPRAGDRRKPRRNSLEIDRQLRQRSNLRRSDTLDV